MTIYGAGKAEKTLLFMKLLCVCGGNRELSEIWRICVENNVFYINVYMEYVEYTTYG